MSSHLQAAIHVVPTSGASTGAGADEASDLGTLPYDSRFTLVASLAASSIAIVLWVAYWLMRVGFAWTAFLPSVTLLGAVFAILNVPAWVLRRSTRNSLDSTRWWIAPPFTVLASLFVAFCAGRFLWGIGPALGYAFAVAGACALCANIAAALRRGLAPSVSSIVGLLVLCGGLAGAQWGWGYQSTVFLERLAIGASVGNEQDTLFHSALTSMIQTFNHASTGLDGAPPVLYHTGSHYLFASLSTLTGLEPIDFYQVGYPILVLPLLIFGLLLLSSRLAAAVHGRAPDVKALLKRPWVWLVTMLLLVGVHPLPIPVLKNFALVAMQYHWTVVSESYGLSIALASLLVCLLTDVPLVLQSRGNRALVYMLALLPSVLTIVGLTKISVMLVILPAAVFAAWRGGIARDWRVLFAAMLAAAATVWVARAVSPLGSAMSFAPFAFMRVSVIGNRTQALAMMAVLTFLVVHYVWLLLYLALERLDERRIGIAGQALLLVALMGAMPGLLLDIFGGSAAYFSDVQRYFAGTLILAAVFAGVVVPVERGRASHTRHRLLCAKVALAALSLLVVRYVAPVALRDNLEVRRQLTRVSSHASRSEKVQTALTPGKALAPIDSWRLLQRLRALRSIDPSSRRQTALYIPYSSAYWSLSAPLKNVFIAPALSGHAMVYGIPAPVRSFVFQGVPIVKSGQYGFHAYAAVARDEPSDPTQAQAATRARALGLKTLLVFGRDTLSRVPLRDR